MALLGSEYVTLKQGNLAPDFSLMNVDGIFYSLQDIKGEKATLIIFMCNHCPYVLPKINEIKRIAKSFEGLTVIGINSNESENYPEDSYEKMQEYFDKWNIDFYYLHDSSQEVAQDYGAVCTPDPFLFDSDLKLIFHSRIDDTHGKEEGTHELYHAIQEFLETGNISVEEHPSMGCSIKWKMD
ncbi:thioredoxin family protein [Candidatus Woesearchaeota archaeon]|nr:thioredoxin family protein [Candidatus Woesearchaeota archaeon]